MAVKTFSPWPVCASDKNLHCPEKQKLFNIWGNLPILSPLLTFFIMQYQHWVLSLLDPVACFLVWFYVRTDWWARLRRNLSTNLFAVREIPRLKKNNMHIVRWTLNMGEYTYHGAHVKIDTISCSRLRVHKSNTMRGICNPRCGGLG